MTADDMDALLRRFVDALNASDWDAALACLDDDVAIDGTTGERSIGRDAFREALAAEARRVRRSIGDLVVMVAPDGVHAAAEFTLRGEPADGQGRSFSVPAGLFFEIADGRIARISARHGLDAAG
ncbi:nuclear transport factor 2 family protein [Antarcticirhabdus aurantiaca]|uniref:Nuclear transport factor 2 family protein n=1 Tax=Antarcticirhabdus aurantiaca TaxID=2606717 RepID=A0ACD4NHF4_9HYPH|nr:nuclear transport factor 2 family protein [Antarcticirhabdus aurantiaca]WAJ26221.1 nuclear transport factor 2 family protein [Jeongeuplla avenae]